jgi:CheY-like chemotaxis protein
MPKSHGVALVRPSCSLTCFPGGSPGAGHLLLRGQNKVTKEKRSGLGGRSLGRAGAQSGCTQAPTTDNECVKVGCVDAAKAALEVAYFDVLILDVVLPKRLGEKPDRRHGLSLLGQISRSPRLNKPEKIVGLTAYSDDLQSFRVEFERYCFTVIEATATSDVWKRTVKDALTYTASSKLARAQGNVSIHVVTVHGIRTFGHWQTRLKNLVARLVRGIQFHSYKYGVFSIVAFIIPPFRWFEVRQLARCLEELFDAHKNAEFVVFSHSFGTLLVAEALRKLSHEGRSLPIRTIVLSGSVLPRRFSWAFLQQNGNVRIINDCCDQDYVLWAVEAFVLGTGMAGKCGFIGFDSNDMRNRFFSGGHTSYFNGDEFMEAHWVPLLNGQDPIVEVDQRTRSVFMHEGLDKIFGIMGMLKPAAYLALCVLFAYHFY